MVNPRGCWVRDPSCGKPMKLHATATVTVALRIGHVLPGSNTMNTRAPPEIFKHEFFADGIPSSLPWPAAFIDLAVTVGHRP